MVAVGDGGVVASWVGATVGPGFDFADFDFLRDDPAASARLAALRPDLVHLSAASPARMPAP